MNVTVKLEAEDDAERAVIAMIHTSCPEDFQDEITIVAGPERTARILGAIIGILKTRHELT